MTERPAISIRREAGASPKLTPINRRRFPSVLTTAHLTPGLPVGTSRLFRYKSAASCRPPAARMYTLSRTSSPPLYSCGSATYGRSINSYSMLFHGAARPRMSRRVNGHSDVRATTDSLPSMLSHGASKMCTVSGRVLAVFSPPQSVISPAGLLTVRQPELKISFARYRCSPSCELTVISDEAIPRSNTRAIPSSGRDTKARS